MALSPGTALQNGQYVIDALLEDAPNGDLYWGTHVATGTEVYIQVCSLATATDTSALSTLIAHLQGVSFAAQAPLPKPFQLFYGEANTLCWAMSTTVGRPWTLADRPHTPMPLEQALKLVRTVAEAALWLADRGVVGVDLSLNRIWTTADSDRITLTGLPQQHTASSETRVADEASALAVRSLAQLLYSCLSGELPQTDAPTELAQMLQQQQPNINPSVVQAISQGTVTSPSTTFKDTIREWLSTLPDADSHSDYRESPQDTSQPPQPARRPNRWGLYPALGITALMAAVGGGTLGTAWRLNAGSLPGDIQLKPDQSFPSQPDWSGSDPEAVFETPRRFTWDEPVDEEGWVEPRWEATEPEPEWIPEVSEEFEASPEDINSLEEDSPKVPAPWASGEPVKKPSTEKNVSEDTSVPDATLETFVAPSADEEEFSNVYETVEPDYRNSPKSEWAPAPAPAPAPTSES
ncbi:MAG: hypothetical protein ACFBSF_20380 [Leptolyngbyaceae cyanobacterium]